MKRTIVFQLIIYPECPVQSNCSYLNTAISKTQLKAAQLGCPFQTGCLSMSLFQRKQNPLDQPCPNPETSKTLIRPKKKQDIRGLIQWKECPGTACLPILLCFLCLLVFLRMFGVLKTRECIRTEDKTNSCTKQ